MGSGNIVAIPGAGVVAGGVVAGGVGVAGGGVVGAGVDGTGVGAGVGLAVAAGVHALNIMAAGSKIPDSNQNAFLKIGTLRGKNSWDISHYIMGDWETQFLFAPKYL